MYPETSKFKKSTFHPDNTVQYFSKEKMLRCQYVALLATRFMKSIGQPVEAQMLIEYRCDEILRWLGQIRDARASAGLPRDPPDVTPPDFPDGPCKCCEVKKQKVA